MENHESIRMTFPNKLSYFPTVQLFAREIARTAGFSGNELTQIDIAIEESVTNVMVHAGDEENPTFDLICEKISAGMQFTIHEFGIPFDPERIKKYELTNDLAEFSASGLGIYLIRQMVDELSFRNLGTLGKETVLVKYLRDVAADPKQVTEEPMPIGPVLAAEKVEYDVRGPLEEEAIEISRCAYKTHGYTFFDDHVYYPERLVELNGNGDLVSAVSVTKEGAFMGHAALLFQYPDDTSAEMTFAFVNAEYRGQGALSRMVDYLMRVPKLRELRGIYTYSVTNHPYTQKANVRLRLQDCGILLATSPASWKFKGITGGGSQRISVVLSYRYMTVPVRHVVYLPEHHRGMILRLLENVGTHFEPAETVPGEWPVPDEEPVVETGVNELEGCAEIFVRAYGRDVVKEVRKRLRRFCLQQIASVNLFLRLEDPLTASLTEEFERLGFFFAGVLPESRIGDALILQYLNNVELDYDKLVLVTDLARDVLAYIRERDPNVIE